MLPDLVLLGDEITKEHWRRSARHAYAAQMLSPQYYESIRLHNGEIAGGLWSTSPLVIAYTKYYDYPAGQ